MLNQDARIAFLTNRIIYFKSFKNSSENAGFSRLTGK